MEENFYTDFMQKIGISAQILCKYSKPTKTICNKTPATACPPAMRPFRQENITYSFATARRLSYQSIRVALNALFHLKM